MRAIVLAAAVGQSLAGNCCWSQWGDASSCGNYPSGGSGPICGNDGVTVCQNNADCDNPAPPTPAPTPPPTPTPTPTPPVPTPPPTPVPTPPPTPRGARGVELLGYLENWGPAIKWWDENLPGNCLMGCFKNDELLNIMKSYSSLNYGFAFLTKNPDPDQDGCGTATPAGPCPEWDGQNIYLAKAGKQDAAAVNSGTTIDKPTSSIIAVTEVVRMGRMHPDGPKRVKIVLGGWSDYARLASAEKGSAAAKLMAKFVAHTFADGVDMDMEHLTPYATMGNEWEGFHAFVKTLRTELDDVAKNWASNAAAKISGLKSWYNSMEDWKKGNVKDYYGTTLNYLEEVQANPPPYLEISWCTRFNAFLPAENPWNYLYPDSEVPTANYETDNEGQNLWPQVGHLLDTVNIMVYDAGGIKINMETVLKNFVAYSGDPSIAGKINVGFEPGEQAAGGVWEGMDADLKFAKFAKDEGFGGAMIWAANPNPAQQPEGSQRCPEVAAALVPVLEPEYAWGASTWTKCNSAGWWPSTQELISV